MSYTVRPPGAATWDVFAELAERNNGVFGGCWCMGFHPEVSRTDAADPATRLGRVAVAADASAADVRVLDGAAS
jgi:hypothetical protein